jgi:methanogenic corrinoid protein MtbC1
METATNYNQSQNYLQSILIGNRQQCQNVVNDFLSENHSVNELYEGVIKPALYEVGRLWEQNKITVATEHMATAITEGILNSLYTSIIPAEYTEKKVVLACVENEEHQVGIKMVADVFEMNKWESYFLGTGFPTVELIRYIDKIKPDLIALSLSIYFNFGNLKHMLGKLKNNFPHIPILVGGQALLHVSENLINNFTNVTYIANLNDLEQFILNFK